MEVLQIAQLLAVVIYASASLVRENQRELREILKRKIQPKTKKMQQITHDCIAFSPSAFGELVVVVLKMLTYRKKRIELSQNIPKNAKVTIQFKKKKIPPKMAKKIKSPMIA